VYIKAERPMDVNMKKLINLWENVSSLEAVFDIMGH
jgi:hypothetical protein